MKARNAMELEAEIDLYHTLPSLSVVHIRLPFPMEPDDYDALIRMLESARPALIEREHAPIESTDDA